jgi:hypothetical protein
MSLFSKIRGTIETLFQLGLGGPQLKNNSGVVEVRNSTDAAFAIARAASPVGTNDLVTLGTLQKGYTLAPGGAVYGSANIAQFNIIQGTNFPVVSDGTVANDAMYWAFSLRGYTSGDITAVLDWYAAATTGNVKWEIAIACYTIGTDTGSIEAKAFAAATNSGDVAVNANAKSPTRTTITITGAALDSAAANDWVTVRIRRIAATASEMSGSALFMQCVVSWL